MVEHYVEDHRHTALVAGVHKGFELLGGTVVFIQSQVVRRVVAPGFIAFELVDGHQLDRVHAEALQVVEGIGEGLVVMAADKIA